MDRVEQIKALYTYSSEEQLAFPYLRQYTRSILPVRDGILSSTDGQERYMLAGLFLTYRAFNHTGERMTTEETFLLRPQEDIHAERLSQFKHLTGKPLESQKDYLRQLDPKLWRLMLKLIFLGPARVLYRFVTKHSEK